MKDTKEKGEAMMTQAQQRRTEEMMNAFAGEQVHIETINSTLYVFGSELACLRIFAHYNTNGAIYNKNARCGYSKNFGTHFFSLESNN